MPRLKHLRIEYVAHQNQALQLSRLFERTDNLKLAKFTRADVVFYEDHSSFELYSQQRKCSQAQLSLEFCYQDHLYVQVPCMTQVLVQLPGQLAVFPEVDDLSVCGIELMGLEEMTITEWLPFFNCFPAVQALRLSGGLKTSIVLALEETTLETVTDSMFSDLRLIWLAKDGVEVEDKGEDEDGENGNMPVGAIGHFLALRQLAGHPITIVNTKDEFLEAKVEARPERSP